MTESVRDSKRVDSIVGNSSRFLSFIVMPVNVGAAAIASQLLTLAYGPKYLSRHPGHGHFGAVLAIPRAYQNVPDTLLRAADRQSALLRCMMMTGILNVALDVPLILRYGAMGAAIGNGIAQIVGCSAPLVCGRGVYQFEWPIASLFRFAAAAAVMADSRFSGRAPVSPTIGIMAGIAIAVPLYIIAVRLFRAFRAGGFSRLSHLSARLPRRLRGAALFALRFAVGADRSDCRPGAGAQPWPG